MGTEVQLAAPDPLFAAAAVLFFLPRRNLNKCKTLPEVLSLFIDHKLFGCEHLCLKCVE